MNPGEPLLELGLVPTLALAGSAIFLGYFLRRVIPVLGRYNVPAPVVGGLVIALLSLAAHLQGIELLAVDTTLQNPLMIAFFTTIGFAASLSLLRAGGPQVFLFFVLASAFAVVQNLIGIAVAAAFDLHPLFGVLTGSATLTGGPATGLAFAPLFEEAGVPGAATLAVAAGMTGIVAGSVIGGPVATLLIERFRLHSARAPAAAAIATRSPEEIADIVDPEAPQAEVPDDEEARTYVALKSLVVILVAMWIGSWISNAAAARGITLPPYIGAMLIAAAIRNLDDYTDVIGLSRRTLDVIGAAALSLFLATALMSLKLWEIAGLALPLLINLGAQVLVVVLACAWIVWRLMGRDYEAAIMSGGFVGFMLGTTANAMAVMRTLVERYGAAPRAFLVVPLVGAFFIDFSNALIITAFVNGLR